MSFNLSVQQSTGMQPKPSTGAQAAVATGSFVGHAVAVESSPLSLIANAAEELTFAADTTQDFELDERKERQKIDENMADRVKLYQELMRQCNGKEQLDFLKRALRTLTSQQYILRQTQEQFSEPADQWAALQEIRNELGQDPAVSAETLAALDDALVSLNAEKGAQIRAAITGALTAHGYEDVGAPMSLGQAYKDTVCNFVDITSTYEYIEQKFGADFDRGLDFLYKALANDMAADIPSMDKAHLEHVNTGFDGLRALQSARSLCAKLLERWSSVHHISACPLTDIALLHKIVGLRKENFVSSAQFTALAAEAKAPDIEHKILFLQELLSTARAFSPVLFDGTEGRMRVIDAVQEAVDNAIAEEDAWLAAQG